MAEKKIPVACPKCGTYTEMERGMFGWKKVLCPSCHHRYEFADVATQVITCENCGKSVTYHAEKKNNCPFCRNPINPQDERQAVGCPTCSTPVYFKRGEAEARCLRCQTVFNPTEKLEADSRINANDAPDVVMSVPMGPDQLIWRHPMDRMPLNTRVIAKGGMYAVGMQGTTQKFVVDGQSVLLSETELRYDAANYDGGAAPMVSAEIFYVRSSIGKRIRWGGMCSVTGDYGVVTDFACTGEIEIDRVTDPASFMRTFGFEPETVLLSKFALTDNGPGPFAERVRDRINSTLQRAMEVVRDERGYTGDDILDHRNEILAEMCRQANEAVAEYGVSVCNMTGNFTKRETRVVQDTLENRITGAISWKLARPITVHPADDALATVEQGVSGEAHIEVVNAGLFRSCKEARVWSNPQNGDNLARADFGAHIGQKLQSRLQADVQQLINTIKCDVCSLQGYAGGLAAKAEALLNQEDSFFASRGLRVRDMTMLIVPGAKSAAFREREELEGFIRSTENDKIRGDVTTGAAVHKEGNKRTLAEAQTDTAVHGIEQNARIAQAQHKAAMAEEAQRAELEAQKRQYSYEAWVDKQRVLREQEDMDYARARRAQLEEQNSELVRKEHEEKMYAIAQRIEQSQLSWREKLDAYARLQRGVSFRDQMEERAAKAEADASEARLRQALRVEDLRAMGELKHEEALREEELAKQRFARELELRRQKMAEEAAQLQAQFERERALAQEQEKRHQAQEEIETLRLMLSYLATSGQQQVTAEALREAREEARLTWQREHEEAEKKAAQERQDRQARAENAMAERAMKMVENMTSMKNEARGKDGQPLVDEGAMQAVILQLNNICRAIKAGSAPAADAGEGMNAWFDGVVSRAGRSAPRVSSRPAGGRFVTCGNCGESFNADAYMCPKCGWLL